MNETSSRRRSLTLLALGCAVPLPFFLGAFLVNVEIAIRVFWPAFHILDRLLPQALYHLWAVLSADLSTVSTLIPLMIVTIPLIQAIRILRKMDNDPTFGQRMGPDPYPSHFGFFQIMLGLTGTLYGMYIGLDVSGVSELAGQAPSTESIRQSLDRLLGGTATALLSSLVGLIGAFITARPAPWIFGHAVGVKADETRQTLTATIERLTEDLRGLSQASRNFTALLNPETAQTLLQKLDRQETATREIGARLDGITQLLEALGRGQPIHARQLEVLETLAGIASASRDRMNEVNSTLGTMAQTQSVVASHVARLDSVEQAVRLLVPLLEASSQQLTLLVKAQQQACDCMARIADAAEPRHQDILKTLNGVMSAAQSQRDQVQREHDALRSALAAYLSPR